VVGVRALPGWLLALTNSPAQEWLVGAPLADLLQCGQFLHQKLLKNSEDFETISLYLLALRVWVITIHNIEETNKYLEVVSGCRSRQE